MVKPRLFAKSRSCIQQGVLILNGLEKNLEGVELDIVKIKNDSVAARDS